MIDKINFEMIDQFDMNILDVDYMNKTPSIDYITDIKDEYIDFYYKSDQDMILSYRSEFEEVGIEKLYLKCNVPEASARTKFYFILQSILSTIDSNDDEEYEKASNMFRNHKAARAILEGHDFIINASTMIFIKIIGNNTNLKFDTLSKQIAFESNYYYQKRHNALNSRKLINKEVNVLTKILIDEMEGYI